MFRARQSIRSKGTTGGGERGGLIVVGQDLPPRDTWELRQQEPSLIRRGIFTSVPELERAIHVTIERNHADPKPFVWAKSAPAIIRKVNRASAR